MKKKIPFIFMVVAMLLFLVIGFMISIKDSDDMRKPLTCGYHTVVIDSCEYIEGFNKLTHKGNCKFCEERKKNR